MKRFTHSPRRRQQGIATILVVLMIGLAVSVTVAATIYSLRGNQQRQLTTHSVTAAQAAAWRGVEALRLYLKAVDADTYSNWALSSGGLTLPATVSGLGSLGVTDGGAVVTSLTSVGSDEYRVGARVTASSGSGSAATTATVEVVYDIIPASTSSSSTVCATTPTAAMVFNGNLDITGGSLGVTNATDYNNIAVSGDITLANASEATISGCAKGNISLSGGGISENGHLYSEKTITITSMSPPSGTTLWGQDIDIGNSGSGTYVALKAGAYQADVTDASGAVIGTTQVGGSLLAATAGSDLPWTTGTVVPTSSGRIVVTLTDGSEFLLDLGSVAIDDATGLVSGASDAADTLSGDDDLPDTLGFVATSIYGGDLSLYSLTVGQMWAHDISIQGYSGTYTTVWANGELDIVTGTISELIGGAGLWASVAGYSDYGNGNVNAYNFPTITSGTIAGSAYYGTSKSELPADASVSGFSVTTGSSGTSPGLPGIPYCDTRTDAVDADDYKSQANYVFEWVDGKPQLTIRNVKTADGVSIAGVYDLSSDDLRTMPDSDGEPFLTCNWQSASSTASACLTDKTSTSDWVFTGLTHFPRGVAWFDNGVEINGTSISDDDGNTDILAGIIAKGYVELTQSGHGDLYAPNYSTPALICDGAFYPTNLCDKTGTTSTFTTWTDTSGDEHTGLPIGNVAIVTEDGALLSGWEIYGNVILGGTLDTAANTATIHGSLTVGANESSTTTVTQGGAEVVVPDDSDSNYVPSVCETSGSDVTTTAAASVMWSRYR